MVYEAQCVVKCESIAQGIPESPQHALGNLWIKIAGFQGNGFSKHKQSGLADVVD